jgi:copper chaperone
MTIHELKIEGMTCGHCVRAIEQALGALDGVRTIEVEIGRARVEADDSLTRDVLVRAIEEEEFRVVG